MPPLRKVCARCRCNRLAKFFSKDSQAKSRLSSYCVSCTQETRRNRNRGADSRANVKRRAARAKLVAEVYRLKAKAGCAYCPQRDPACLDFHHVDPSTKTYNINRLVQNICGLELLLKEIAKCEVVCANCHRKLHRSKRLGDGLSN